LIYGGDPFAYDLASALSAARTAEPKTGLSAEQGSGNSTSPRLRSREPYFDTASSTAVRDREIANSYDLKGAVEAKSRSSTSAAWFIPLSPTY
jgi:hypothetical protein